MPLKSKSRTTIERPIYQSVLTGHRLPTHGPPVHPGEMLLHEFIKPLRISQSAFALRMGVSFPRLNEIIHAKRGVSVDTALRIAQVTGMRADFWMGLQLDWDLWHLLHSPEGRQIAKLKRIPRPKQRD